MINEQEARRLAMDALQVKNIPFREANAAAKLVTAKQQHSAAIWRVSFDIPMPVGMQDEYFTVVVNAETGAINDIITPTGMVE